ncbi:DHH family phosphoesterase [uncultured Subdoligranulum sp.]|uniref:DHH family phosphoesterase n=1 Tax=uncultured Subdoligranulum sp. TaxID=512298 RepID=UPI00260984ED|nr:DHH family phosphoesterase [uncultured Subdoligranulum sp.]
MKHNDGLDTLAAVLLLLVAVVAMIAPVALLAPVALILPAVVVLIALGILLIARRRLRAYLAAHLCSTDFENSRIQYSLTGLPIPTMLVADGRILWYNNYFRDKVLEGGDVVTRPVERVLPDLDLAVCSRPHGQDLTVGKRRFTAYSGSAKGSRGASIVYLVDDTFYKETLDEYTESRPVCLIIVIDSYDELFDDMKDSEQAKELEAINSLLEQYISRSTGFLRRVSNSRYIAVVEERDVRWMLQERFEILDKVRALHPGGLTTLSIGVGHGGKTLQECHQMARESIDIALGRGGDQAAVKTVDGFEFYGGISHGVEKRSHVRSRIIANALCDLIKKSDSVIVMGHRMSDLDAVGSAIGVLRMCKMCGVPAVIALNSDATLASPLLKTFLDAGQGRDFVPPDQTLEVITPKTLLIVVDTYQKRLLESQKIYEKCKRVVVIDHHRMAVGHIDNPLLLYHEPYASSASELVCELLQFLPKEGNVTPLEAQALLAGIMLDTRSFALHVGVRTFEAAAWLRSRGAQTADTKLLFNTSKEEYEARAHIVEGAYIYKGCAIALSGELDAGMNVVLPMAANDLLTINGVDASFVAVAKNGGVNISARSMGALNVQVILEPLGGGGHLMMAGAQLQDCTLPEAERRIREQIDLYRASQAANAAGSR